MTIYKYFIFSLIILICYACGIKSDPIPKSSLNIPYPSDIDYSVESDGLSIYNGSNEFTLFVERAEVNIGFINLADFKRVALINPNQTYLDTDVVKNRVYKYRFRHYNGRVKTYSPAVVKTIKYYIPIKHSKISVTCDKNGRVCVYPRVSDVISRTVVTINGINVGEAKNGLKTCFKELPQNAATISVIAMPYDKDNNMGIPYRINFQRDTDTLNLPPQNVEVRRKGNDIVLTWDKEKNNPKYNVYITEDKKDKFIKQVDVELFRYNAPDDKCVDFKLTSVRRGKESKKISVSACK